ncbi:MAG: LuxR family transcriptional regulator [Chloroflexota bacterium]|nr:MAG: LuxR family transcriptional regulator [Chloroflexota bacterium]
METPILRTKIYIPQPQPGSLIPRPSLLEKLDKVLEHRLTLISASAGSGKTTLVSQWLSHLRFTIYDLRLGTADQPEIENRKSKIQNPQVAWLSLDEADNDPVRFWSYVIAALETVQAGLGDNTLPLLRSSQPSPLEIVLTFLLNDLAALPHDVVLVLDDYHLIENSDIHTALTLLIDRLPPLLHLILTSRADPPLPLARWRAKRQLTELRAEALRFTPDEVAFFLNQMIGLNLTSEQIAALEAKTEGWVAGLQLVGLSLQGRTDVEQFIAAFTGTHRYILDYMTEEILRRQPENVQTFLLQTSILERLTGLLCDAVTGRTDSQALLEQLGRANLFILPLDDQGQWCRYHHLFADLLRHYLQQAPPSFLPAVGMTEKGGIAELHRRAATWYEQAGFVEEAIYHTSAAHDFEWTKRLMLHHLEAIIKRGEATLMLRWFNALPEAWLRSQPKLNVLQAWLLFLTGHFDEAQRKLAEPEILSLHRQAPLEPDEGAGIIKNRDLPGLIVGLQAHLALIKGDVPRALELSQQALAQLAEADVTLRGVIAENLAPIYWLKGEPERAHQLLAQFGAFIPNSHALASELVLSGTAELKWFQGQYRQAFVLYQRFLQEAAALQDLGALIPVMGTAHTVLGYILYEWNELAEAEAHLRQGIELGNQGMAWRVLVIGYTGLGRVLLAQKKWDEAAEIYQQADQLAQDLGSDLVMTLVTPLQVDLWLAQGDLAAVNRWLLTNGLKPDDEFEGYKVIIYIFLVRALLTCGQREAAEALLLRLLRVTEAAQQLYWLTQVLVLQALTFQAQNKREPALAALKRALVLGEPEGYTRTFVNEGAPMAALLLKLREGQQREHGDDLPSLNYLNSLLAALGAAERVADPKSALREARQSTLAEPLTERELEVLHLLTTGLSTHDIATKLIITPTTLKTHLRNIYAKLEVNSRAEAMVKAKALNLFE